MLRVMNTIIMFSSKLLMQINLRTETSFSKFVELCVCSLEVVGERCAAKKGGGRVFFVSTTVWKE